MQETFHYLLLSSHLTLQKLIMQALEDTGLTSGQPKILDYLREHDGCIQKDLADACHVDAATIVGLLNRMKSGGLLSRRQQDGNRRSFFVYLTEKGRDMAECVNQAFERLEEAAFHGFSPEERRALTEGLRKFNQNLQEMRHRHE